MTTLNIDSLRTERDIYLNEVRGIAAKAESDGRGFTSAEDARITDLLAKAKQHNADIGRLDNVKATAASLDKLWDGDRSADIKAAAPNGREKFAKAISDALFGTTNLTISRDSQRTFMDANGNGNRKAIPTALNAPSGRAQVPIARRQDGNEVFALPEWGGTVLDLLAQPRITEGDTYRIRRQLARDEDAAKFVPKGAQKPETPFDMEVIDDRVRTVAVLSEPIPIQDLQDVPGLKDDIGNELANRVLWRLENAVINGDSALDVESFDGILATSGILTQPYFASPFRTIRRSLTTLEAAGYDPNLLSIVMNPTAWEALETETDENGRPLFSGLYTARQNPVLFGRPVVLCSKLDESETIVGDYRQAALTLRTDLELAWSDGGDLFKTNTVRFRAEMRAGFNLVRPGAFVHAALEASADPEPEA